MLPLWYGRLPTILWLLKKCKCLSKVWGSRSKTFFCPVVKYWQFDCSEVYKTEQVKCSSQRQGCRPKNTPVFLLAILYAMACSVSRVSLHMNSINCSKKLCRLFFWHFTSFHCKALAEVMSKSHPYSTTESGSVFDFENAY